MQLLLEISALFFSNGKSWAETYNEDNEINIYDSSEIKNIWKIFQLVF